VAVDFEKKTAAFTAQVGAEAARQQCEQALKEAGYGLQTFAPADLQPDGAAP
jgi:hypothetical protein